MDSNDNKSRFSDLYGLTSDSDGQLQHKVESKTSVSYLPSSPEKMVFALLELTKWPTLPAPWSSVDSCETRVWGLTFL
jgi:hypothetical protein